MSTPNDGGPAFPFAPMQETTAFAHKFISRINGGDWSKDRCWDWVGGKTTKGYGVFAPTKKTQFRAHRFSLQMFLGREPSAMVLHKCDNPSCVNPFHLEEGSHGDNMKQMAERKRATREERHHKAKLTFNEVLAINLLHAGMEYGTRELASMFGVSQPTVAAITKGDLWPDAHIAASEMLTAKAAQGEKRP